MKSLKELNLNKDEKVFISCALGAHRAAHTQLSFTESPAKCAYIYRHI